MMVLASTACTGLAGEPEIVATVVVPTAQPATPTQAQQVGALATPVNAASGAAVDEPLYPESMPDLANGARLFAANCTACHGTGGAGDGPLAVSGQIGDPGNFLDPEYVVRKTPFEWYEVITNGRLEKLMPPWRNAMTQQERWDVAMYVYTLRYTAEQWALGETLFAQNCAECHGEQGRGDGPTAIEQGREVADLNNIESLVTLSDNSMYNIIAYGQSEVMPAFADIWGDDEIWAALAYARSFTVSNIDGPEDAASSGAALPDTGQVVPPALASVSTTITGLVTNQTAGARVEPGLTVALKVFDATTFMPVTALERETTLGPDNTFTFEDVPVDQDKYYLATVQHAGRNFASGLFQGVPENGRLSMPVTLYELTDNADALIISGSVAQINVVGDNLEITQVVQIRNTSDRVFTSLTADEQGRYPWLALRLPPGALLLGSENPDRYIYDPAERAFYDTSPLLPNEERLIPLTYLVGYGGGAVIEYEIPYRVDGPVRLLVNPLNITVRSEQLPSTGEETLGQVVYNGFGQDLTLPANSVIRYELSGAGRTVATGVSSGQVSQGGLLPLLLVAALMMVAGGVALVFWSRRGGQGADVSSSADQLIRQIAALDAEHEAGRLNHDLWQQQRAVLKAQLAALMGEQTS